MFRQPGCGHPEQYAIPGAGNTRITRCTACGMVLCIENAPVRDMRPHVEAYRRLRTAWHARGWK